MRGREKLLGSLRYRRYFCSREEEQANAWIQSIIGNRDSRTYNRVVVISYLRQFRPKQ